MSRAVAAAALVPVALATAITLAFAALDAAGRPPLSHTRPANMAEAAGLGIAAETLRFLRAGENPVQIRPVRQDIISSSVTRATALEAAIWSRRVELIRLLDRERAIPQAQRPYLACLATAIRAADIAEYLAPGGVAPCDPEATYRAIAARAEDDR